MIGPSALRDRRPAIEIADFGNAGVLLLAEYDAEDDTIRVNARAVDRVRSSAGAERAEWFVACAIAHERFHRMNPVASEDEAHEHVRRTTGFEPLCFETYVRDAARER